MTIPVISATVATQPLSPSAGDTYILPSAGWSGSHGNEIAQYDGAMWQYTPAAEGSSYFALDSGAIYLWTGASYTVIGLMVGYFATDLAAALSAAQTFSLQEITLIGNVTISASIGAPTVGIRGAGGIITTGSSNTLTVAYFAGELPMLSGVESSAVTFAKPQGPIKSVWFDPPVNDITADTSVALRRWANSCLLEGAEFEISTPGHYHAPWDANVQTVEGGSYAIAPLIFRNKGQRFDLEGLQFDNTIRVANQNIIVEGGQVYGQLLLGLTNVSGGFRPGDTVFDGNADVVKWDSPHLVVAPTGPFNPALDTDSAIAAWTPSTVYSVNDVVKHDGGNTYICITAGTSASSGGPTGTGTNISDGPTCKWNYTTTVYNVIHTSKKMIACGGEVLVGTVSGTTWRNTGFHHCGWGFTNGLQGHNTDYDTNPSPPISVQQPAISVQRFLYDSLSATDCDFGITLDGSGASSFANEGTIINPNCGNFTWRGLSLIDSTSVKVVGVDCQSGGNVAVMSSYTTAWAPSTAYDVGDIITHTATPDPPRLYLCTIAGTSDSNSTHGPSGTGTLIVDGPGTLRWQYISAASFYHAGSGLNNDIDGGIPQMQEGIGAYVVDNQADYPRLSIGGNMRAVGDGITGEPFDFKGTCWLLNGTGPLSSNPGLIPPRRQSGAIDGDTLWITTDDHKNSTTLVPISDLTFKVEVGVYAFEATFIVTSTATSGYNVDFAGGTATAGWFMANAEAVSGTAIAASKHLTLTADNLSAKTDGANIRIEGAFSITVRGTIIPQGAWLASSGVDTRFKKGSTLSLRRLS